MTNAKAGWRLSISGPMGGVFRCAIWKWEKSLYDPFPLPENERCFESLDSEEFKKWAKEAEDFLNAPCEQRKEG